MYICFRQTWISGLARTRSRRCAWRTEAKQASSLEGQSQLDSFESHLRRRVPPEYQPLIAGVTFNDIASGRRFFSDKLTSAVLIPGHSLLSEDPCGRTEVKSQLELEQELKDENLLPFGRQLKHIFLGKHFIDLGCADPEAARLPRSLAQAFKVKEYIGVDIAIEPDSIPVHSDFRTAYFNDDMLSFLAKIEGVSGLVIYISGMELDLISPRQKFQLEKEATQRNDKPLQKRLQKDTLNRAYVDACLSELQRICKSGDAIIIGRGTRGFKPEKYSFKLVEKVHFPPPDDDFIDQALYIKE